MYKTVSLAITIGLFLPSVCYAQAKPPVGLEEVRKIPAIANQSSSSSIPPREATGQTLEPLSPISPTNDLDFTISKQVDEVSLILSVTDAKGRFVDNLTADD